MSGYLVGRSASGRDNTAQVTDDGALKAEPLGVPGVARQITADGTSSNIALTATCRRLSMRAVGADMRYKIGSSSQTATVSSHFIAKGERLDVALPVTPNIAVIRDASDNGVLEVTELL